MCSLFDYFVVFVSIFFLFFTFLLHVTYRFCFCFCLSLPLKRSFDCEQKKSELNPFIVISSVQSLFVLFIQFVDFIDFSPFIFHFLCTYTRTNKKTSQKFWVFMHFSLCVSLSSLFDSLILYIFTPTIIYNMHELFFSPVDFEYFVLCVFFSRKDVSVCLFVLDWVSLDSELVRSIFVLFFRLILLFSLHTNWMFCFFISSQRNLLFLHFLSILQTMFSVSLYICYV